MPAIWSRGDVGVEAAGVAVGADAVRDGDALGGPGRDGAARAEVHVVRVRRDDQRSLDHVLVHCAS
jgi:hypothetical protein